MSTSVDLNNRKLDISFKQSLMPTYQRHLGVDGCDLSVSLFADNKGSVQLVRFQRDVIKVSNPPETCEHRVIVVYLAFT